jgi:hypothetical protein
MHLLLVAAILLPAGTPLQVRLKTKVASNASKPNDAVEALLIQPVVISGEIAVPAGAPLAGAVKAATPIVKPEDRASLLLSFTKLGGTAIDAKVTEVDNARESVDETGAIVGILSSETLAARIDRGVKGVSQKSSRLGSFLDTVKSAVFQEPQPEVVYEPGVEMTLALIKPAEWKEAAGGQPALAPVEPEARAYELVNSLPFQTTTEGGAASDLTNLMFIGSEQELTAAFEAAGWAAAAGLSANSKLEVVRAVVESRGYKEAPVSILLLDGKPPELVFQKQNNTFAMRHHLRIWKRPVEFDGKPVWVCAATHDIGIDFSPEQRDFIHKIDSQIDRERAKVVADLLLTGKAKALSLVSRPAAPQHSQNATGDKLETDGRMAVIEFQ